VMRAASNGSWRAHRGHSKSAAAASAKGWRGPWRPRLRNG
jgi:hypothetical protein